MNSLINHLKVLFLKHTVTGQGCRVLTVVTEGPGGIPHTEIVLSAD